MKKETMQEGTTVDIAVLNATRELNVSPNEVNVQILQYPQKGFLGIGNKKAIVKVTVDNTLTEEKCDNGKAIYAFKEKSLDEPVEIIENTAFDYNHLKDGLIKIHCDKPPILGEVKCCYDILSKFSNTDMQKTILLKQNEIANNFGVNRASGSTIPIIKSGEIELYGITNYTKDENTNSVGNCNIQFSNGNSIIVGNVHSVNSYFFVNRKLHVCNGHKVIDHEDLNQCTFVISQNFRKVKNEFSKSIFIKDILIYLGEKLCFTIFNAFEFKMSDLNEFKVSVWDEISNKMRYYCYLNQELGLESGIINDVNEFDNLFLNGNKSKNRPNEQSFFRQLEKIDLNNEVIFIYSEKLSSDYFIARYIAKYAKKDGEINNVFSNDRFKLHFTVFNKSDYDYIGLMKELLCPFACCSHEEKMFYESINFYGVSAENILSLIKYMSDNSNYINKDLLKESYEAMSLISQNCAFDSHDDIGKFLECFKNQMLYKYLIYTYQFYSENCFKNKHMHQEIIKDIKIKLRQRKIIPTKWQKEFLLYTLIKKSFEDAIFQYRAEWLGNQSLDIFVPSVNIALEYQGIQHYQAVDFFGGEEAFHNRVLLDDEKRKKCRENNVELIEWKYTENINEITLKEYFKEKSIDILFDSGLVELPEEDLFDTGICNVHYYELLNNAAKNMNFQYLYSQYILLIQNQKTDEITESLEILVENKREYIQRDYLEIILSEGRAVKDFLCIIASSEKLISLYVNTKATNFYKRKLILYLIKFQINSKIITDSLNFTINFYIKQNNERAYLNYLKLIADEAQLYEVSYREFICIVNSVNPTIEFTKQKDGTFLVSKMHEDKE